MTNHTKPNLQLFVSTNKPDHMAEFLEATSFIYGSALCFLNVKEQIIVSY